MALATPDDVAVPLGRPIDTDAEQAQVTWWLEGIERHIVARLGAVSLLDPSAVRYVEAEAVAAKVRRAGRTESSISVAVDDATVTRRYEGAASVGAGDINDEWWDLLKPAGNESAAFTVSPYRSRQRLVGDGPWGNW
jgi:hypothetical protein